FHSGQILEKLIRSINTAEVQAEPREYLCYLFALIFPQQPIIDKDTRQAVTDGTVNEQSHHRGIDPTAQPTHDSLIANALADLLCCALDKSCHRPSGLTMANAEQKVLQDLSATFGVNDLWMKL